jgi:hypothetical protein
MKGADVLSRLFVILVTVVLLAVAAFVAVYYQEAALALTIFGYLVGAFVTYHLNQDRIEVERKNLVQAATRVLGEELQRNYCVAHIFETSLLSTAAWDAVVEDGIVLKMEERIFEALLKCYSAIRFYNHDVEHGNNFAHKQVRVKQKISDALKQMDCGVPSHEECCTEKLVGWADRSKLERKCAEVKSRHENNES